MFQSKHQFSKGDAVVKLLMIAARTKKYIFFNKKSFPSPKKKNGCANPLPWMTLTFVCVFVFTGQLKNEIRQQRVWKKKTRGSSTRAASIMTRTVKTWMTVKVCSDVDEEIPKSSKQNYANYFKKMILNHISSSNENRITNEFCFTWNERHKTSDSIWDMCKYTNLQCKP